MMRVEEEGNVHTSMTTRAGREWYIFILRKEYTFLVMDQVIRQKKKSLLNTWSIISCVTY